MCLALAYQALWQKRADRDEEQQCAYCWPVGSGGRSDLTICIEARFLQLAYRVLRQK